MESDGGSADLARRIGAAIGQRRKAAGFTQARVADAIGVEKETISRIENGAIAPSIFRLAQFAELFRCPVSALFGEYTGRAVEDAAAIADLIDGLPPDHRQTILRLIADVARAMRMRAED